MEIKNKLVSIKTLAEIFRVPAQTVSDLITQGDLPAVVRVGDQAFFREADLHDYLAAK